MSESADELIPTRWKDEESWRDFFNYYWKLIYGVALKSGLSDPRAGSFKGFLLLITRRRIADHLRKRLAQPQSKTQRRDETRRTSTVERIPDPPSLNLDTVWDDERERNLIDTALERVKRRVNLKHFQIYDPYVVKQWPVSKVTQTLNVNIGQVYLAKHRISHLLKKELARLRAKAFDVPRTWAICRQLRTLQPALSASMGGGRSAAFRLLKRAMRDRGWTGQSRSELRTSLVA